MMAAQEFCGLDFKGALKVELQCSSTRDDVAHGPAQEPTWQGLYRYGTTVIPPERLKIDAPLVCFSSQVKASGTGIVDDWETGIVQSISDAFWVARYCNGAELRYRVNTCDGLVRDGEPGEPRFFRKGHPL